MEPWHLKKTEWKQLRAILEGTPASEVERGRPRLENNREAAQACLFRHFHSLSPKYKCFGWNDLPKTLGVSPITANRRFREWTASGAWGVFWDELMQMRRPVTQRAKPLKRRRQSPARQLSVADILFELERAYFFFNDRFFGGSLAKEVAITLERQTRSNCRGYFCARLWKSENRELGHIAISTSVLGDAGDPLAVLLHEMVHLRNNQAGIRDCNPRNQYHNRHFRDTALLAGLDCPDRNSQLGYVQTRLNDRGQKAITDLKPHERLFHWKVS